MGRFKKGLFFGGLLGAGLTWMATTKKGRETRDQITEHAAKVYDEVKKTVLASPKVSSMTQSAFVKEVQKTMNAYASKQVLPDGVKRMITKLVTSQWKRMQQEIKKKMK